MAHQKADDSYLIFKADGKEMNKTDRQLQNMQQMLDSMKTAVADLQAGNLVESGSNYENDFQDLAIDLLRKILKEVEARPASVSAIPVAVDLWDTATIAAYLKRTPSFVRETILPAPNFPAPIRLPSDGRTRALYKARDVISWAEKQHERR